MTIGRTCTCGRRALPGSSHCELHQVPAAPADEAARNARQPYRSHYSSAEYRRNRAARRELAGGRCESCGRPLGSFWQCHHVVAIRDGGDDSIANLRCLCASCHAPLTRNTRRSRRR